MPNPVAMRLHDALLACDELAEFTAGQTFSDYMNDTKLRRAVERSLHIVGESISQALRIEPEIEEMIPDAIVIIGMRNRIAHGYREIKDEVIWEAAATGIPEVATTLRQLIATLDGATQDRASGTSG